MKTRVFANFALTISICLACLGLAGMLAMMPQAEKAYAVDADLMSSQLGDEAAVMATTQATSTTSKPAKPTKAQLKAFKKASADFALELFGRCVADKGKAANVTISPMSVMTALAVTANGAGGKTAVQLRKVLGDNASMARINKNLAWYNSKLVKSKKALIRNANSIWYHNDGSLVMNKAFLNKAKKYYGAEVTPANFAQPSTVEDINNWVAKNTNDMIKHVIGSLDPRDRIALINALYFDAEWLVPYTKGSTQTKKFTTASGNKRKVKMMYGTEHKYISGKNVEGFIKPYAKGYSYVALLPKKGMSLKKYISTLDGDTFRKLVNRAKTATVRTALPKYSLSYSNDNMENQLAAMGITSAFSGNNANFTNMASDTMGNLHIGSVVHKTKIELDEQGTKAAAVTAVMMKANSALIDDVKTVYLNRPFIYAIIDNTTKLPVFIGTVNTIGK